MIKSIMYLVLTAAVIGIGTAQAQTFTFESKSDDAIVVGGVGPQGAGYVGTYGTGSSVATNADGSKNKSTSKCISMMQPPNNQMFDAHVACDVTSDTGSFSLIAGCTVLNRESNEMSCVAGLTGKTGDLEGRSGAASWQAKGNISKGTGQWHE